MALRLGISSSMLPNFRGRLCLQRPSSSTTLCRNPVCVQFLSGSVPGCQKCLLRGAPRRPASRAPVSAADGEWDANSFHCRSCGDAHDLGTSGWKHEDWVRSARGQGLEDGRQDVSRDSSVHFVGVERLYRFQTGSSSTSHRSHFFAAPSSSRLNNACAEQSCGLRGEMKVQEISESQVSLSQGCSYTASPIPSAFCPDYPAYSMLSRTPLSCNCFCDSDRGMASGAGSWGMRKLPIFHCHVSARFSPMSVGSWPSVPSNFSRANSLQCKRMSGSASSHLTSPTADHPSCAAPDSSKGLAPAGLLSVASQEVQIWDHEHPGDARTREDEQESDLRSESMSLRAEDFLGLNGSTLHEGMAFAVDDQSDGSIQHAENTRTGPTQFVVGEEVTDAESQMETAVMKALERSLGSPLGRESQVPPSKPLVIVISGPSGVGKDVVIKKLQEQRNGIHFVVTATTRPQRPGEVDGHDYFFVSKEKFQSMIDTGELLEHAVVYGDFKGIPKQQVRDCMAKGTDVVLRVDVQGAATVRSILGSNAVFIFLVAESEASLVKRLITRKTETLDKVVLRVATAREELKRLDEFDYAVVNADGQVDRTVSSICSIIDAEKSRVQQRTAVV